jgi:excisionase family DNA binding protein
MSESKPAPNSASGTSSSPNFIPRLLRISDAAFYLSVTYGFMETLIRERTIPSFIQGRRRVLDIRDLDDYADRLKENAA